MKRLCCALLAAVLLTACAPSIESRICTYQDEEILITGLAQEDFTVTPAELTKLPLTTLSATGATQKAGTVALSGVLLTDFLEHYGFSVADIEKVRFRCKDGYKVFLKQDALQEYTILLGIAEQSGALEDKRQPLRVLIPGEDSGKWAYGVIQIDFIRES